MLQEDYKNCLSSRLKALLEENNMTQKDLSLKIGVSPKTIQRAVNHGELKNIDTVVKISKNLNVSVDYLLGISNERN